MNRRGYLIRTARLIAASSTVWFAGCLSLEENGSSVLGRVVVLNRHNEPHTVDFRVEWENEVVHESTHELEANEDVGSVPSSSPERTWPDEPGRFTVSARKADESRQTVDPADRGYPECYSVSVNVSERGHVAMFTSTNEHECSDEVIGSKQ